MKYHNITKDDKNNGEGLRVVLWTNGCSHHCRACHCMSTWNKDEGLDFDENAKKEIFDELEKESCSGLTLSGGDPLLIQSREEISKLVSEVREKYPDKNIWCYTGYTWENLLEQKKKDKCLENILDNIDVLIDGMFISRLALDKLRYVGSSNQYIIDVRKSLEKNKKIIYIDNEELQEVEV